MAQGGNEECSNCQRHASKHQELFGMLSADQADNVQIMLCTGIDCLVGHQGEWE